MSKTKVRPTTKKTKSPGYGKKRCLDCGRLNPSRMQICSNCGFDFPAAKKKRDGEKLKDQIIRSYAYALNRAIALSQGKTRNRKGSDFEKIIRRAVRYVWTYVLDQDDDKLFLYDVKGRKKLYTPLFSLSQLLQDKYYKSRSQAEKTEMRENLHKFRNHLDTDVKIEIDGKLVSVIEVKGYCEAAMLRRVINTFKQIKMHYPKTSRKLFMFESALGGNFSIFEKDKRGSSTIHRLLKISAALDSKDIYALLDGKRDADKPIYKKEHRKAFTSETFDAIVEVISNDLRRYAK